MSGRNLWVWLEGGGYGWNLWVWLVGVVVRWYIYRFPHIYYLSILLLYMLFFAAASLLFVQIFSRSLYYIKVGNKVFRQQMGILMGTDRAPLLTNLFFFLL